MSPQVLLQKKGKSPTEMLTKFDLPQDKEVVVHGAILQCSNCPSGYVRTNTLNSQVNKIFLQINSNTSLYLGQAPYHPSWKKLTAFNIKGTKAGEKFFWRRLCGMREDG